MVFKDDKTKNLENILCGVKNNKPNHARIISIEEEQYGQLPKLYCFDARNKDCYYSLIHENKSYCKYKWENYNENIQKR